MPVKLDYFNHSFMHKNPNVVIFHKNELAGLNTNVIAWHVIRNCGKNNHHPFLFSGQYEVCISDSYGNFTPKLSALEGGAFELQPAYVGRKFYYMGKSSSAKEISVKNSLERGAIDANIYMNNALMSVETNVVPKQRVSFQFSPTIWVGVVEKTELEPGQKFNPVIDSSVNAAFSLVGIQSAAIVLTGGAPGQDATPLSFSLENVQWC